jgi:hypothetical protein
MGVTPVTPRLRLTLPGVGAMSSPPLPAGWAAGPLPSPPGHAQWRPGAEPAGTLAAWLVSDERSELRRELRALAAACGLRPAVAAIPSPT